MKHSSIEPYRDTDKYYCPDCQRIAPKNDLLNPKLSHSECFNPHPVLTRLGKPPKDAWQCQECKQVGTFEYFYSQECPVLLEVCKYCGERPECSADCLGMFLVLSDPDFKVIDGRNSPLNRNPDDEIRKLTVQYQTGDEIAGIALLARMVRAGLIPESNVQLAAAYRFPPAIGYLGREPKEEEILPLDDNPNGKLLTPWNLKIYVQRGLAAITQAYLHIKPVLDSALQTRNLLPWTPFINTGADHDLVLAWIGDSNRHYLEARKLIVEWLEHSQDEEYAQTVIMRIWNYMSLLSYQMNGSWHLDIPEIYNLLTAVAAVLWIISSGLEKPGTIPMGIELATASAMLTVGYHDEKILRKPMFYGEHNRFRQEIINEIFDAICQSMVPILLKPFPVRS